MAIIIGGHETGLLNGSNAILDRNDRTGRGDPGHGEELYVNVSNGNLLIEQRDAFLPSLGDDYQLVRTYNARGRASDAHQHEDARWTLSTSIRLDVRNDGGEQYFEVEYGDGTFYQYEFDAAKGVYVSTDGAGAFETIEDLNAGGNADAAYVLTRADQTRLTFDQQGHLMVWEDTNGVRMEYTYESDRLVQVRDDQGHVINYLYQNGVLHQVVDEVEGVLVEYRYTSGQLSEVIDRYGHSTKYFYTNDGFLERIVLPSEQMVDGVLETYDNRELSFQYTEVNWRGNNKANAKTVTQITDAQGGITSFDYDFNLTSPSSTSNGNGHEIGKGKGHFKHGDGTTSPDGTTSTDDKFFLGGSTTVVDALGNNRAYSNEQQYQDWRLENGYYAVYDAAVAAADVNYQQQVDAIRAEHSMTYSYDADGYIVDVVDQEGFHTSYTYDEQDNLISITDRNGWGAVNSDSNYYRDLRASLGYTDIAGNGKLVSELTTQEIDELKEAYTRHFSYDANGNLLSSEDNSGNATTFTYTSFNKVASITSAVGNALVSSDEQQYQDKRVELGFAALIADLTAADQTALLDLHTTTFAYDANQNLIERVDAGGDYTHFEYDVYGNQTKRIVYLDGNDLVDPAKQQVTQYFYDAFGNKIETVDGEGNRTFSEYDHFGNLVRFTDGNGGITTYTYDNDNRLLTVTDPEGHTTTNTYDAVGNRISVTDANGHTITRIYSLNNLLIATIDPSESDPTQDRQTQFNYDVVGNNTSIVDAEGRETTYVYNSRRELVEVVTTEVAGEDGLPTQYSTTYAYDGEGNRITTNNNRGYVTELIYNENGLLSQQTDPNGHVTQFVYDANYNQVKIIAGVQLPEAKRQILSFSYDEEDQVVSATDAEGNVTTYGYDAPGNRVAVTDANGHTTEFEYDHNNRLIREIRPEVTDPVSGSPVRYTVDHIYDANGNEVQTIDENGHSTRFSFDKDNQLVMVEDANAIKTVFTYDSRHNRTSVQIGVDAAPNISGGIVVSNIDEGQITTFAYDEFNQLISKTDGMGNALAGSDAAQYQQMRTDLGYAALVADLSTADQQALKNLYTEYYTYDRVGNQLTQTDNLSRTTQFEYDALNRLRVQTDALAGTTTFRYDGNDNIVSSTDAEGREATFVYDEVDRLTHTTDPLGVVTRRDYDDFGNLTAETRAAGVVGEERTTTFEYDLNNRLIRQIDPGLHSQTIEYDAVGNRILTTDGRGNSTQYLYDALNRNVKIIDPLTFETQFEYDGVGNRISLIDARNNTIRFDYDPGNRLVSTTDAENRVTTYVYDVRSNRIEMRTAAGTTDEEVTVFEYDAENNLRSILDAEGYTTENDYDRVYNRVATTDGNGHTTVSEFDALNRVVQVTDAENGVTSFAYDAVNNRVSQTDSLGRTTSFSYDDNDRLIVQVGPDSVETHYAYDSVGNRTSITRAANTADAVTETFTYNLDDLLVAQADGLGNTTAYTYDENHNRTIVTDPNGHATTYTYDENNQVVSIQDPEGNIVSYTYDGNGNRTQVTDGRGFVSTTYYNANNEVSISVDAEGYATTYQYDNNGNVVSQTLHAQPLVLPLDPAVVPTITSGAGDRTIQFEYDKLNRATARVDGEGYRREFEYDAVGNRLQTRQFIDLAGTQIAINHSFYDAVNREVASVTAEGYLTLNQYDAVGNRIQSTLYDERVTVPVDGSVPSPVVGDSGRVNSFVYEANNRLISTTDALGIAIEYEYDDRGNRTALVEAAGTADQRRTEFSYDAADRLVDTTDALGVVTRNIYDADGNVVERHDAYGTPEVRVTAFAYDGNHRLISQTDALGVVTQFGYDAEGNMVSRTSAAGLPEVRTETFEYDGNGRRIAEVNGEGERTEFTYDGAGNRISLTQAPGLAEERSNFFEFDLDNRLVAEIDGEGVRTEHRYDGADNRLETIEAVDVLGQERSTAFSYDLDNRLLQTTDPLGHTTSYEYDVLDNRVRVADANGGVQQNTFDILGRQTSSQSAEGVLVSNSYDLRGNVVNTTRSFADSSDARTTTYTYDLLDRRTSVTDGEGFTTTTAYDAFDNRTQVTSGQYLLDVGDPGYDAVKADKAFVQTESFIYDAVNRLTDSTDGEGHVTHRGYDAVGNMTSLTQALGLPEARTTTFTYDLANRLTETATPEGGTTRNTYDEVGNKIAESILQSSPVTGDVWINRSHEYDDNGRLTASIDPYGVRTERSYDAVGNEVERRAAAGSADERVTRMEYDLDNRVTAEIDGEGYRTEYVYDSMDNRIRSTDPRGGVTHFYYNADNQLTEQLDAEGYLRTSVYDSAGNRIESRLYMTQYTGVVDDFNAPTVAASADDRVTTTSYDRNNRAVQITNAEGGVTAFAYDAVGNQTSQTDALGRITTFAYDLDNRMTVETAPDDVETHYAYDAVDNRISMTEAAGTAEAATTTFAYDLNNRLVSQTDPLGATSDFSYDKADNQIAITDPLGHQTQFAYDLNNRLVERTDALGNSTSFSYDDVGNQVQMIDGRGFATTRYYDDNNQVILTVDAEGYATSSQYDGNGNLISQTLHAQAVALPVDPSVLPTVVSGAGDRTLQFSYDLLDRATLRVDAEGYRTEFSYDAEGNRLQSSQYFDLTGTKIAVTTSFFDVMNREVASVSPEGYLSTAEYDAVGNLTQRTDYDERVSLPVDGSIPTPVVGDSGRVSSFVYDANNRLVSETNALGIETQQEYDARGNRTALVEAAGTTDQRRTDFNYDAADRLVDVIDALGVVTRNIYDADGNITARHDAYGTLDVRVTAFVYDGNHRLISQTDALGVITQFGYDAEGNMTSRTSAFDLDEVRTETFEYDGNGRQTAEVNGEGERTEYTYDGAGNRTSLTQAPGLTEERSNSFEFDLENRMVAMVDANGTRTEYVYDGAGNKLQTTQAVGLAEERHSFYEYDLESRLTQVTDPIGAVTQYVYDALGNQTRITYPNGGVQQNSFDALGRLIQSISAGDVRTTNSYDDRGNIVSTTQSFTDGSDSRTTLYAYDLLDRQTVVTNPEGFSTSIVYDNFGNQTLVTHGQYLVDVSDPAYDATKAALAAPQSNAFEYDAADRLVRMVDGVGTHTDYLYNGVGDRISMTEAANVIPRTTTYSYDKVGREIEVLNPEGGITRSVYDEVGNRIAEQRLQSVDGLGVETWSNKGFEYDDNGNLTAEIDPFGVRTEYVYDAMGNRTVERRAAGTADERVTLTEYDLNNRDVVSIDGEGNRTEYAYDSSGNRIKVTDALGRVARYYFDLANQMTSILDPEGYVTSFNYDSAGNQTEVHLHMARYTGTVDDFVAPAAAVSADDRVTTLSYDGNGKLVTQIESDGSTTEKQYDALGNLVEEIMYANTSSPRSTLYQYDNNSRLVHFTDVDGTVTEFTYDAANNRLSENILGDGISRKTTFEYDLNNRKVREAFDPAGLNFVQTLSYDKLGNVVSKTDANSVVRAYVYDLNNRLTTETIDPDGLALSTTYVYDAVGNSIEVKDARENTTFYTYDDNDRVVNVRKPAVQIYTIEGDFETVSPTTTMAYDAAGNEVQVIDANGYVTTRYFDGNNRLVAELNGYNALREYSYNAAGDQVSETLYMTQLSDTDHDPSVRPAAPSGENRVHTREYDLAGRLTRTLYPSVDITTLNGAGGDSPSVTTSTYRPEETMVYDAFGNVVEMFDKNGNRTVRYYDVNGRTVAQVDKAGYLVEWEYDSQGNLTEQRSYETQLSHSSVDPATRPTAPTGNVRITNWTFNAANQTIEEVSPQISVFDPVANTSSDVRPKTVYEHDANGNQTVKILGAGTPQRMTEYSYYDANNRVVAVVNGSRTLHFYDYDANGNVTRQERFINIVPNSIDLTTASADDLKALRDSAGFRSADHDQATEYTYNADNLRISETNLMGAGAADDHVKQFGYDALGQRTYVGVVEGASLFTTETQYNALGLITLTRQPDGSGTISEFDVAGNQILGFTGAVDSGSLPATNLTASLGGNLSLSWNLSGDMDSYVVYGDSSKASYNEYPSRTGVTGSWGSSSSQANIDFSGVGNTLFYRVVTIDRAGNLSWTDEHSVTIPPKLSELHVSQPAQDALVVNARFDNGVQNPTLSYGTPLNTNQNIPFVQQPDGSFSATISPVSNPQELAFKITWEDSSGGVYSSTEQSFEASALHLGIVSDIGVGTVGSDYTIHVDTDIAAVIAQDFEIVTASWRVAETNDGFASAGLAGDDSVAGIVSYGFILGDSNPLAAGTYEVVLEGVTRSGDAILLDNFTYTVDGSAVAETRQSLAWTAPVSGLGSSAFAVVDGVRVDTGRPEGTNYLLLDLDVVAGNYPYTVYYTDTVATDHTLNVTSTEVFDLVQIDPPPADPVPVSAGFDLDVNVDFDASEIAEIVGDVHMAWRPAASGDEFSNSEIMSAAGNTYSSTLARMAAGQYDIKIYYHNTQGQEVIVDWYRADTTVANHSQVNASHKVVASELDGDVSLSNNGLFSVDEGLYLGKLDHSALLQNFDLEVTNTGRPGDSLSRDGRTTGYFTKNVYNDLDHVIAEVSNDGIYREYGTDANGNAVETRVYGKENAVLDSVSYTAYDNRDRAIAQFDAAFTPHGESTARHAITRMAYDLLDNKISETDPRNEVKEWNYNALGAMVSETDALGNTMTHYYDVLGRETAVEDGLGNRSLKFYDAAGRMVSDVDGSGVTTSYTYDAFDRKQTITNGRGHTIDYDYDQANNLTKIADAEGGIQQFVYDDRGNRISTTDQNGNTFTQRYDALNRVIETVTRQEGKDISETRAYDYYGNLIAETDGAGRTKSSVYGDAGRVLEKIDEGGDRIAHVYDAVGRLTSEYTVGGGKDISRFYDAAGNLERIEDHATNVTTVYGYDIAGNRVYEHMTTPENAHNRTYTYQYNERGELVRWHDAVTGMHLNYVYDEAGNLQWVFTDLGYDPDSKNVDPVDPNFRHTNHWYEYDGANRVTMIRNGPGGSMIQEFSYDEAGNRKTWNDNGNLITYTYDNNSRVTRGEWTDNSGTTHANTWEYDAVGNVKAYRTFEGATETDFTTYEYFENNKQHKSITKDGDITTYTLDDSGLTTKMVLKTDSATITYNYEYYADTREKKVTARGDKVSGSSETFYDANEKKREVNRGKDNDKDRPEISTFLYNNDGFIVYKHHDSGEGSKIASIEYAYANGNAVGETGTDLEGVHNTLLDVGNYSLIKELDDSTPSTSFTFHTVNPGDTLQSIAGALYGNPSLWFVIAEANGLSGSETLKTGMQLQIPNNIKTGRLTSEAHALYKESDIIGSSLPNLKSEGGGGGSSCAMFIMIVAIVVIAVVAPYAIGALAGVLAGTLGTIGAYIVAGAVVGALASIATQGVMIALGFQESFDWGQVGAGALAGAFTGAAQGIAKAAELAQLSGTLAKYAKVASAALQVAGKAVEQYAKDGKITSWTSLAAAGIGAYGATARAAKDVSKTFETIEKVTDTITPWVQLAETAVRNDGNLTPSDWAGAIGSTLSQVVTLDDNSAIENAINRTATNVLVGGALSLFDRDAGKNYIINSVGNEVGQAIGGAIAAQIPTFEQVASREALMPRVPRDISGATQQVTAVAGDRSEPDASGQGLLPDGRGGFVDENGNPVDVPVMLAGAGELRGLGPLGSGAPIESTSESEAMFEALSGMMFEEELEAVGPSTRAIEKGDTLWGIAAQELEVELGRTPSNSEIVDRTKQLIEINPGIDPRALAIGEEINLADASVAISAEAEAVFAADAALNVAAASGEAEVSEDVIFQEGQNRLGEVEKAILTGGAVGSVQGGLEGGSKSSDPVALEALIIGNVTSPDINKALRIRGTDGVVRFQDPETGRFTQNPFSREQLEESRNNGFKDAAEFEVVVKQEIFKAEAKGVHEITPQLSAGSGDDFIRAGLLVEGASEAKVEATLGKEGLALGAEASADAALSFASGQVKGDLGKASFDIASKAEAKAGAALKAQLGGPLGVQADVSASGKLEAVALQFQGSAETAEVDLLFGFVQAKGKVEGDFNVGGIGISGEAGFQTLESRPGFRAKLGAGATALLGGKVKGSVEISFNTEKISNAVGRAVDYLEDLDFNPFD